MIYQIILLFSANLYSQTYFAGKSVEQIKELKKEAVLKIEIRNDLKKETHISSAFLLDREGDFITVNHDLRDNFIKNKTSKIRISDSRGNEFSQITIKACSNDNLIDVCVGKINNSKFNYFFEFSSRTPNVGQLFTSIGHCGGDDFSFKNGEVLKLINDYQSEYSMKEDLENKNTQMFEVSNKKCVGDSGSPLFDSYDGSLIGMYSFGREGIDKRYNKRVDQYFAIDSREIKKLYIESRDKILINIPSDRMMLKDPCIGATPGTRTYINCKKFD